MHDDLPCKLRTKDKRMPDRLVTIFGGSGFIGRHLVGRLAAKGYQIRLAVRDPESAVQLMTQGNVGQIVGLKTNIRNQISVNRAVASADIAFIIYYNYIHLKPR